MLRPLDQFRVGLAHGRDDRVDNLHQGGLAAPQQPGVPHPPPQDPPQHVAPPLVGRIDPVAEQEGHGAAVVGEHPVAHPLRRLRVVWPPHDLGSPLQKRPKEIDMVVGVHTLQHRSQALQPRPGVDGGRRKRVLHTILVPVELHEYEVPQLEELAPLPLLLELVDRQIHAPLAPRPQVVVHLRTRPAGPRIGHLPEVVLVAQPVDARPLESRYLVPQLGRLVVGVVHRRVQPVGIHAQFDGQEVPRVADGLALEVVPEREVPEHLEEGVVARGAPDLFQIVVLSAGPEALLGGDRGAVRRRLFAQKHALELDHARVGEQQAGIVPGNQGRTRYYAVSALFEEAQKALADFSSFHLQRAGGGKAPPPDTGRQPLE